MTSPSGNARAVYRTPDGTILGHRNLYLCGATSAADRFSAYWPHTAYFCPECGEIWARMEYSYEFDYAPRVKGRWTTEIRRCEAHGDGYLLVAQPLDHVSPELLLRELNLLLKRTPA